MISTLYTNYSTFDFLIEDEINPIAQSVITLPSIILTTPEQFSSMLKIFQKSPSQRPENDIIKKFKLIMGGSLCSDDFVKILFKDIKYIFNFERQTCDLFYKKFKNFNLEYKNSELIKSSNFQLQEKYELITRCLLENKLNNEICTYANFWTSINQKRKLNNSDVFIKDEIQYALFELFQECPYLKPAYLDKLVLLGKTTYQKLELKAHYGVNYRLCDSNDFDLIQNFISENFNKEKNELLLESMYTDDNISANFIFPLSDCDHEVRHSIITDYLKNRGRNNEIISYDDYMKKIEIAKEKCLTQSLFIKNQRHVLSLFEKLSKNLKNFNSKTKNLIFKSFYSLLRIIKKIFLLFKELVTSIYKSFKNFVMNR